MVSPAAAAGSGRPGDGAGIAAYKVTAQPARAATGTCWMEHLLDVCCCATLVPDPQYCLMPAVPGPVGPGSRGRALDQALGFQSLGCCPANGAHPGHLWRQASLCLHHPCSSKQSSPHAVPCTRGSLLLQLPDMRSQLSGMPGPS